ncbi:MAG: hypothetical protein OXF76_02095 [Caldilineaceae bacterium]|nr:hypothetical protein [Caldilineaceae bacterium]
MPRQTEPSANNALGNLLQAMLPRSEIRSEHIGTIAGHPGFRPDVLITAPGSAPVVIEAEYMPAAHVEEEARQRLGLETTVFGRPIEAAVALRYPAEVGDANDLHAALSEARLSYCAFTENGVAERFPKSGWLDGSVEDLADMVGLSSVLQHVVDGTTTALPTSAALPARLAVAQLEDIVWAVAPSATSFANAYGAASNMMISISTSMMHSASCRSA